MSLQYVNLQTALSILEVDEARVRHTAIVVNVAAQLDWLPTRQQERQTDAPRLSEMQAHNSQVYQKEDKPIPMVCFHV